VTSASPAQELVGAVLNGRFRLVRLLGEGGMGAVYEADSLHGEGKRAVKLLHQEFVKEELILQRFFAEAQATRTLNHPNVAQVQETATAENGTPYLVMELLQGTSLATYTDRAQALTPPQAVNIAYGVLQALSMAHGRGIVHRDLKPDNLFLVGDVNAAFNVKLLDFGIAKVMELAGGMGQKTRTGVLLGTPGYMSPEQVKNSKGVDARTDLWSVAVILYELLTAQAPFPGDNEFSRLTSVLSEEPKPIDSIAPHLAGWAPFFQRALMKDPARRFQTADEMAQGVLAAARGASLRPPPPPTIQGGDAPEWPRPPMPSTPHSLAPHQQGPYSMTPVQQQSGVMAAPMSMPSSPVQAHSGLMQSPASMAQPPYSTGNRGTPYPGMAEGVTQQSGLMASPMSMSAQAMSGPMSRPGATVASVPPPSMGPPVSSGVMGGIGPTHVSAQRPVGTPTVQGYTPSIDIVDAPPLKPVTAPLWVVAVVGFCCFGLGLALGLVLH
jgi:serine/threonine-protein kinase